METASVWQGIKQKLRLIDDRGGAQVDDNISYVAAGYAPMSVRLVQILGNSNSGGSWSSAPSMNEVMRLLPGPLIEFTQVQVMVANLWTKYSYFISCFLITNTSICVLNVQSG